MARQVSCSWGPLSLSSPNSWGGPSAWHRTSPMPAVCLQSCPKPGHQPLPGKITWGLHVAVRGGGFSSPATVRHTVYFHFPWPTLHLRNRNGAMASKTKGILSQLHLYPNGQNKFQRCPKYAKSRVWVQGGDGFPSPNERPG